MAKTIKQIADEIGVSKTAVRKQIANHGLQSSLRKNGNQFAIDEKQEALILKAFLGKSQTESANHAETKSETSLQLVSVLEIFQKELEIKNKQISELNARLAEISAALVTAQQTARDAQALHAGMIQQRLTLPEKTERKLWQFWKRS
jgi:orotate phosphoribosyltransferase-like protein